MAVLNQVLHRKKSDGTYDDVYLRANLANVTGTLAIANGGTGATDAATARNNLGAFSSSGGTITGNTEVQGWFNCGSGMSFGSRGEVHAGTDNSTFTFAALDAMNYRNNTRSRVHINDNDNSTVPFIGIQHFNSAGEVDYGAEVITADNINHYIATSTRVPAGMIPIDVRTFPIVGQYQMNYGAMNISAGADAKLVDNGYFLMPDSNTGVTIIPYDVISRLTSFTIDLDFAFWGGTTLTPTSIVNTPTKSISFRVTETSSTSVLDSWSFSHTFTNTNSISLSDQHLIVSNAFSCFGVNVIDGYVSGIPSDGIATYHQSLLQAISTLKDSHYNDKYTIKLATNSPSRYSTKYKLRINLTDHATLSCPGFTLTATLRGI